MNQQWHTLTPAEAEPGEYSAVAHIRPDSGWFDGHFPGMPILPGIAQLAMVEETLRQSGCTRPISGFAKVRFRQLIRPDDTVTVTVTPDTEAGEAFRFKVTANGRLACAGIIETAAR